MLENFGSKTTNIIVLDLEGFKLKSRGFIIKELSLCSSYNDTIFFKPPLKFADLPAHDRQTVIWLTNNLHVRQRINSQITAQNVKHEYSHSGHKVMHREDTSTLTTYLSDNLKIFTCFTPLDNQPIVIFNRVQDPSPPIQNNFSSDHQNRANYLNNKPNAAQQPRYNSFYSTAAKRYFATITLSPDELDSFRAFLPVIDNFYHFQLYVKNKQSSRTSESVQLWL